VVAKHMVKILLPGRFSQTGLWLAMLAMRTVEWTGGQRPAFRLLMTEAPAVLLTRVGMAHRTSRLYQKSWQM
jgi:hypothetical protein